MSAKLILRSSRYPKRDRISKLPSGIIETILCFLPIQEAARTSILSSEWRYHWIKIPKLVFNERTCQVATDEAEGSVWELTFDMPSKRIEMDKRCKFFYAIYQVLLMHEGPLHEFTLCMEADDSCVEIDHIVRYLLKKNTVKILKLDFGCYQWYELPVSLFSLHQLTNMYISNCALIHKRSFDEFGCLTTLYLESVQTHEKTIVRLLSSCPVLKRLTLHCGAASMLYSGYTPLVDLFKCFLEIEYLSITFYIVTSYVFDKVPKELPTTFVHLKDLFMKDMCFNHKYGLPFLVLLIRCCPNLEKLKLEIDNEDWHKEEDDPGFIITVDDCSDIMLEHLNELEIKDFYNSDDELDFVKLIYAKSPVLKKVRIFPSYVCDEHAKSHLLETLSGFPCASPLIVVKIKIIALHR